MTGDSREFREISSNNPDLSNVEALVLSRNVGKPKNGLLLFKMTPSRVIRVAGTPAFAISSSCLWSFSSSTLSHTFLLMIASEFLS